MTIKTEPREIDGWKIRQHFPPGDGPHPLTLLLHGWTGDETVMWVFASRLPKKSLLVAPRGLHPAPSGGYGWEEHEQHDWPWVDDFQPSIEALLGLLTHENFPQADLERIRLVGFSQRAALSYAFALTHPTRIAAVAGLAGFMPQGAEALARNRTLTGMPVFIAHGARDKIVPVERARHAVEILEAAGAQVTYCEEDVGHKLSANCFRGLETFFVRQF
jgi:phospholipase/carboxylesterase